MELDLTPKKEAAVNEGEGGGYYSWTSDTLAKFNLGCGRLLLHPRGFALPHYADSSKFGYVFQGTNGVAGMVLPTTKKEVVVKLKQGDIIPVPIGSVSWWFNNTQDSEDLIIVFLGDTSKSLIPGQINYFFLTGNGSVIRGFSTELTSKIYNLTQDDANKLKNSQNGTIIIEIEKAQAQHMPKPNLDLTKKLVYNIDDAQPDNSVTNGGLVTTLTNSKFPFIGEVGLSVIRVKLEPNAIKAPSHSISPVARLLYIARGSGKVEIVGLNGQLQLDTEVNAGDLIVIPQFFVAAEIAGDQGMESYSVLATLKPLFGEFSGKISVLQALSPTVEQVSLNLDSEFLKLFIANIIEGGTSIIPPNI